MIRNIVEKSFAIFTDLNDLTFQTIGFVVTVAQITDRDF